MNEWADDAFAKLEKQRQDRQLRDQVFLEKQRLKTTKGVPLWREIRQKAKENCEAFNLRAGKSLLRIGVGPELRLIVASDIDNRPRELDAHFDVDTAKLSWTCGEQSGEWEVAVLDDGSARFQFGMIPTTTQSMVKQMLDALVFE